MKWSKILTILTVEGCLCLPLSAQPPAPGATTNGFQIQAVTVKGKAVPLGKGGSVNLGAFPENIFIGFDSVTNAGPEVLRIRHSMDGFEHGWHEGGGEMYLAVRFFNDQGDQIEQRNFPVHGESADWNGSLISSPLTHRRETLVAPAQASSVWIVISSAGPPSTVGIYVIADLIVSKSSGDPPFVRLIQLPFDHPPNDGLVNQPPPGWTRDGTHASMAKIVEYGGDPTTKVLAIVDDDPMSHAEWHTIKEAAPRVAPGDHLLIEWNEMYSLGVGDYRFAKYAALPPGNFQFNVEAVDIMGNPTGPKVSLAVLVPQPFWRRLWFWCLVFVVITGSSIGGSRYWVWHKLRREMSRLKSEQALEQERLRIAQDIHDDLGARVTQISLVSAMASQNHPHISPTARADFDRISKMSRELVSALYETVWAVDPDNDNMPKPLKLPFTWQSAMIG